MTLFIFLAYRQRLYGYKCLHYSFFFDVVNKKVFFNHVYPDGFIVSPGGWGGNTHLLRISGYIGCCRKKLYSHVGELTLVRTVAMPICSLRSRTDVFDLCGCRLGNPLPAGEARSHGGAFSPIHGARRENNRLIR
jgi:hypothetical protein